MELLKLVKLSTVMWKVLAFASNDFKLNSNLETPRESVGKLFAWKSSLGNSFTSTATTKGSYLKSDFRNNCFCFFHKLNSLGYLIQWSELQLEIDKKVSTQIIEQCRKMSGKANSNDDGECLHSDGNRKIKIYCRLRVLRANQLDAF